MFQLEAKVQLNPRFLCWRLFDTSMFSNEVVMYSIKHQLASMQIHTGLNPFTIFFVKMILMILACYFLENFFNAAVMFFCNLLSPTSGMMRL